MTRAVLDPAIKARWQDPTGHFARLIVPVLTAQHLRLIKADVVGDTHPSLLILLEPLNDEPLTLDKCAAVSKLLSATLDVADPISGKYTLDVGSAGSERPLIEEIDFERFAGFTVKIKLTQKDAEGRAKLKGSLKGLEGTNILVDDLILPASTIKEIRLVADDYYFNRVKQGTFPKPIGDKP